MLWGLAAAAVWGAAPAAAQASTYVFQPVADARINSADAQHNYGASTQLVADASPENRSYLRFDVRGIHGTVTQATMRLNALNTNAGGLQLRGVADASWGERTIKYANAPGVGPVTATSGPMTAGEPVDVDATQLVSGDGLLSVAVTTASTASRKFSSREVTSDAPRLVVETDAPDDPVIAAAGDIACDPAERAFHNGAGTATACRQRATSDLLVGRGLAAVLPLGDNQYAGGTLTQYNGSYDPSWGRFNAISHPVPGTEEYRLTAGDGYFDYFNGPGASTGIAGPTGEGWYSYDIGTWHLIALNSNCAFIGGCGDGSPEGEWLQADLASHPSSCILAYFHHPRFTSGRLGDNTTVTPFWEDLYAAGADVVLSGDDHTYERFARQDPSGNADPGAGIREFVVGTGGKSHPPATPVEANSGVRDIATYGVLEMTLRPSGYEWRLVPESTNSFTDAGQDGCTGPMDDSQSPSVPASVSVNAVAGNRVELSWKASTDNDGVSGYRILRDGVDVGETTVTTFVDGTPNAGQPSEYRVVASDPSGNDSSPSPPVTVTPDPDKLAFVPSDDATVLAASPNGSLGANPALNAVSSPRKDFLLKFGVSGVGVRPVSKATLRLFDTSASPNGGDVHAASNNWNEGSVTWNTAPSAGAQIASFGAVAVDNAYTLDITGAITSDGDHSLRVVGESTDGAVYASKEAEGGNPPLLVLHLG